MRQIDFISDGYPTTPGYQLVDTSFQAAKTIKRDSKSDRLRGLCLKLLLKKPMTADEIAEELGEDYSNVRPRITELKTRNLIVRTGERRRSRMGNPMNVWRAK